MAVNEELEQKLAALALDALDADERADVESRLGSDPAAAAEAARLQDAAAWLGSLAAATPATALRSRVLDAAQERRAARAGVDPDPAVPIDPVEIFRRGVTASIAEIEQLSASDWTARLLKREWDVREMVGHLLGAARYLGGALGRVEAIRDLPLAEHVAFTQPWIDAQAALSPSESTRAFAGAFTALAEHAETLDDESLAATTQYYGFDVQRSTALVAASFELWAHVDDIRRAVGHPPLELSGDELSVMCRLAGGILPFTMGYVGTPHPGRTARLVLTGPGGGTYVVSTGADTPLPGGEDALVVVDALGFCRIAGRHLDVDELDVDIEGDEAFARDLLSSARVLAS
jgi:uncharacterized protein (TIGR03083 family)